TDCRQKSWLLSFRRTFGRGLLVEHFPQSLNFRLRDTTVPEQAHHEFGRGPTKKVLHEFNGYPACCCLAIDCGCVLKAAARFAPVNQSSGFEPIAQTENR